MRRRPDRRNSRLVSFLTVVLVAVLVSEVVLILMGIAPLAPLAPLAEFLPFIPPVAPPASEAPAGLPTPLPGIQEFLPEDLAIGDAPPGAPRPALVQVERIGIEAQVFAVGVENGFIVTPPDAAGFWYGSSSLGQAGNTVIVGHNRPAPQIIFMNLPQIGVGDEVRVTDQFGTEYGFQVVETQIIQVEGAPVAEASRTLDYIQPSGSPRLTLYTCYPSPDCSARFVAVATPLDA
jgi:LPXTG-site transpeptidase (sortase) family protein